MQEGEGRLALAEFPSIQLRIQENVDLADSIASGREILTTFPGREEREQKSQRQSSVT